VTPTGAPAPTATACRAELESIAVRAGEIALAHFRRVSPERKADRTLVTLADREVESYVAAALATADPTAGIVGEEGTVRAGEGGRWYVVDPIDGTSAFVAVLPTWCVCIGLIAGDEAVAGVVHLPSAGETYSAAGGEAWWNGSRLPLLRDAPPAGDPFVAVDSKAHRRHRFDALPKVRSLGSAAYHTALVARGVARAALLGDVRVWDLAAAGAVLAAVGGALDLLDGGPVRLGDLLDGRPAAGDIVAGSPASVAELRAQLRG
jgi:myo-inositol-1(or 4)-monophosphatase